MNVHDTEKFFYSESRVCGMLWSQIVTERELADEKYICEENIFLMHKRHYISRVFICKVKIVRKNIYLTVFLINIKYFLSIVQQ